MKLKLHILHNLYQKLHNLCMQFHQLKKKSK